MSSGKREGEEGGRGEVFGEMFFIRMSRDFGLR